jgi:hypothetical protein
MDHGGVSDPQLEVKFRQQSLETTAAPPLERDSVSDCEIRCELLGNRPDPKLDCHPAVTRNKLQNQNLAYLV